MSLRKAINAKCKSCVYDELAAGTWLAQVTLCSILRCPLFEIRPTTDKIPESVLKYYGVSSPEALNEEWDSFRAKRKSDVVC